MRLGYKKCRSSFCDLESHLVLINLTYNSNRGSAILWQGVNELQTKSVHKTLPNLMKLRCKGRKSRWHRNLHI